MRTSDQAPIADIGGSVSQRAVDFERAFHGAGRIFRVEFQARTVIKQAGKTTKSGAPSLLGGRPRGLSA